MLHFSYSDVGLDRKIDNSLLSLEKVATLRRNEISVVCRHAFVAGNTDNKKQFFKSHIKEHHSGSVHLYTDASKTPDLKRGCAVVSRFLGFKQCKLPDGNSVEEAELQGILLALELIENNNNTHFTVFTDSLFGLQLIEERFHYVRIPVIEKIFQKIQTFKSEGKFISLCYVPAHVGITGNEMADKLAKQARRQSPCSSWKWKRRTIWCFPLHQLSSYLLKTQLKNLL